MSLGGRTAECIFILNHQGRIAGQVLSKQSALYPLDWSAEVSPCGELFTASGVLIWPFSVWRTQVCRKKSVPHALGRSILRCSKRCMTWVSTQEWGWEQLNGSAIGNNLGWFSRLQHRKGNTRSCLRKSSKQRFTTGSWAIAIMTRL